MSYMDPAIAATRVKNCERKKLRSKFIGMIYKELRHQYRGRKVDEDDASLVVSFQSQRWPCRLFVVVYDHVGSDRENPSLGCIFKPPAEAHDPGGEAWDEQLTLIRKMLPGVSARGSYSCPTYERMTANDIIAKWMTHIELALEKPRKK